MRKLIEAASKGQAEVAFGLLSSVSDDKKRFSLVNTALRVAAGAGQASLVGLLLDYGASPNRKDGYGDTALMYAAMTGQAAAAQVLLARGADPDVKTAEGVTALMRASAHNRPDVVRVLLEHGANPHIKSKTSGETALMMAARSGCLDAVTLFVGLGVSLEDKTIGGPASGMVAGLTPLMFAAANGQPAIVKYLVSQGANVDACDENGDTPASIALRSGDYVTLSVLSGH